MFCGNTDIFCYISTWTWKECGHVMRSSHFIQLACSLMLGEINCSFRLFTSRRSSRTAYSPMHQPCVCTQNCHTRGNPDCKHAASVPSGIPSVWISCSFYHCSAWMWSSGGIVETYTVNETAEHLLDIGWHCQCHSQPATTATRTVSVAHLLLALIRVPRNLPSIVNIGQLNVHSVVKKSAAINDLIISC